MNFGYIRVSTKEQDPTRQIESLKEYVPAGNITIDYSTGRRFNREQYQLLKEIVRSGDHIYFHELDRLGRTKKETIQEIRYFQEKGVFLHFLNIPTTMVDPTEFQEYSSTVLEMINNLLIEVLTTIADTEYQTIQKRQAEGIQQAKKRGKYKGRNPSKRPKDFSTWYKLYKNNEITKKRFCELCRFKSYKTLDKHIKEYESNGEQTTIHDYL